MNNKQVFDIFNWERVSGVVVIIVASQAADPGSIPG